MSLYHIHVTPFQHLSKCIHKLLDKLSLDDDDDVNCSIHFNLAIVGANPAIILDLHFDIRPLHPPGSPAIPFWVGECGFSSSQKEMERQLMSVASIVPEMDVAIMVSIREVHHDLPAHDHPLRSMPVLPRSSFTPTVTPHSLDPVIVEGVNWLEVKSVTFRVFLRGPDGEFDFKQRGSFFAQGVSPYSQAES